MAKFGQTIGRPATPVEKLFGSPEMIQALQQQENYTPDQPVNQGLLDSARARRAQLQQEEQAIAAQREQDILESAALEQEVEEQLPPTLGQAAREEQEFAPLAELMGVGQSPFEMIIDRGNKMADAMHGKNPEVVSRTYLSGAQHEQFQENTTLPEETTAIKSLLLDPGKVNAARVGESAQGAPVTQVDPRFARTASAVVDKWLLKSKEDQEKQSDLFDDSAPAPEDETLEISRSRGDVELGQAINNQWQREVNYREGRPVDDFKPNNLTRDDAEHLGRYFKELYSIVNPNILGRVTNGEGQGANVTFQLTLEGKNELKKASDALPNAFLRSEIAPSQVKIPQLEEVKSQPTGRQQLRGRTTVVKTRPVEDKQITEAKLNANSVTHTVDRKRAKIFYQLGLPILAQTRPGVSGAALNGDLFDIGPSKVQYFKGEASGNKADTTAEQEYMVHVSKVIEDMVTAARYMGRPLHLDYAVQELQNRIHVEQTHYNPQGKPLIRFLDGNPRPSRLTREGRDSNALKMFKEAVAVYFLGAGNRVPEQRRKLVERELGKIARGKPSLLDPIVRAGRQINASLLSDDALNGVVEGLKQTKPAANAQTGRQEIQIPVEVGTMPELQMPAEFLRHVVDEGIEGLYHIEAAAELARFVDLKPGQSMTTHMDVELDGKTHGPISNGVQLGLERAEYRGGIKRRPGATKKLDRFNESSLIELVEQQLPDAEINSSEYDQIAGDLRDGLAHYMTEHGEAVASNTFNNDLLAYEFYKILKAAIKDRENFLKKSPMTMGYGQLIDSLVGHVKKTIRSGKASTQIQELMQSPTIAEIMGEQLTSPEAIENAEAGDWLSPTEQYAGEYLYSMLVDALNNELHPDFVAVGQTVRANMLVAAMVDEVMSVRNALGFETYIGGRERVLTGESRPLGLARRIPGEKAKDISGVKQTKAVASGSAIKAGSEQEQVGGQIRGRSLPALIQGIDGAWMNRTLTGKSWERLKDGQGNAYINPIMDAVKTDLDTAYKAREEANKNWLAIQDDWSMVDELMGKSGPEMIEHAREVLNQLPQDEPIAIGRNDYHEGSGRFFRMWGEFVKLNDYNKFGNLRRSVMDTMAYPPKQPGESMSEYKDKKKMTAGLITYKIMNTVGGPAEVGDATVLTPRQMRKILDAYIREIGLVERNAKTVREVGARRAQVKEKRQGPARNIDLG